MSNNSSPLAIRYAHYETAEHVFLECYRPNCNSNNTLITYNEQTNQLVIQCYDQPIDHKTDKAKPSAQLIISLCHPIITMTQCMDRSEDSSNQTQSIVGPIEWSARKFTLRLEKKTKGLNWNQLTQSSHGNRKESKQSILIDDS